ncbi:MAG TPA: hypothetical protein VEQ61_02395, partial [Thermoleophilaceae bacterium]|nr:hypothetical protein [Thermoleophilaceae bacterium]
MSAVLAGDGLERVAEITSVHAGARVAVVVPSLGGEGLTRGVGGAAPRRQLEVIAALNGTARQAQSHLPN